MVLICGNMSCSKVLHCKFFDWYIQGNS